jgi:hypothetical protein
MHPFVSLLLTAGIVAGPAAPHAGTLSPARNTALPTRLAPGRPTVFLFFRPASRLETALAESLQRDLGPQAGLRRIPLQSGEEPLARKYEVTRTPTAIVYDRRGRLVARTDEEEEIRAAVRRVAGLPRIDWAADDDPRMAEVERLLGRRPVGGIMRTMSLRPEWLALINQVARKAHFTDGALDRRMKEMVATYVSAINHCKF